MIPELEAAYIKDSLRFYRNAVLVASALVLCLLAGCNEAWASIPEEEGVRCVIGEAANQGYTGMLAVADALQNRGHTRGVYGCTASRLGKEPAWVWKEARRAWNDAKTVNPTQGADHWEAIYLYGKPKWAYSMIETYHYKDHTFYKAKR